MTSLKVLVFKAQLIAESTGAFESIRHTGLELFPQQVVVNVTADQHQLILARTGPVGVVNGKAFAR